MNERFVAPSLSSAESSMWMSQLKLSRSGGGQVLVNGVYPEVDRIWRSSLTRQCLRSARGLISSHIGSHSTGQVQHISLISQNRRCRAASRPALGDIGKAGDIVRARFCGHAPAAIDDATAHRHAQDDGQIDGPVSDYTRGSRSSAPGRRFPGNMSSCLGWRTVGSTSRYRSLLWCRLGATKDSRESKSWTDSHANSLRR
jgi:hypothetical protein